MRIGTRIQKGWTEASQATGLPLAHQGNRQTDPDWPGIAPTRGEDWSIYDLMLSQLAATVGFFRGLGIRAAVSHLAFEPAILDAPQPAPTEAVVISFVGTVSADHQQRVALLEAIARRYELKPFGNIAAFPPPLRCTAAF